MTKLISCREIIETLHDQNGEWEVCANAEASYDDADSRIIIELESLVRRASASGDGELRRPPWLPDKSQVIEHAPREEASQVAHEVFASWVNKVRHSIPASLETST